MALFETASLTEKYRSVCEDRVAVFTQPQRTVVVVSDGAGGVGSGAQAAETVIREVELAFRTNEESQDWVTLLRSIDSRIGPGEATAVIVELLPRMIRGASVGDSQAWVVCDGKLDDLTVIQVRKPLLGSGKASPVGFSADELAGVLLATTDGFCNYVKREQVTQVVAQSEFYELPRKCLDLVRLPSGELWDDVGIVACRQAAVSRTRQKYSI